MVYHFLSAKIVHDPENLSNIFFVASVRSLQKRFLTVRFAYEYVAGNAACSCWAPKELAVKQHCACQYLHGHGRPKGKFAS